MIADRFKDFIEQAKSGKKFIYGKSSGADVPSKSIMSMAYNAYRAGKVTLVQQRTGSIVKQDGKFDYIAVKK